MTASSSLVRPAIVTFAALTLVTGVAYPVVVTLLAQVIFPHGANGSLIARDGGRVAASPDGMPIGAIGSELIGQEFSEGEPAGAARYFWGRLSATSPVPYTALNAETRTGSTGSNLAPTNPALVDAARARMQRLRAAADAVGAASDAPIPVDLVTSSGSGLDPHISVAAAEYQVRRVARARGLDEARVRALVRRHTHVPLAGAPAAPVVHVLRLNCALDEAAR